MPTGFDSRGKPQAGEPGPEFSEEELDDLDIPNERWAWRTCIVCDRTFWSRGPGFRTCKTCLKTGRGRVCRDVVLGGSRVVRKF